MPVAAKFAGDEGGSPVKPAPLGLTGTRFRPRSATPGKMILNGGSPEKPEMPSHCLSSHDAPSRSHISGFPRPRPAGHVPPGVRWGCVSRGPARGGTAVRLTWRAAGWQSQMSLRLTVLFGTRLPDHRRSGRRPSQVVVPVSGERERSASEAEVRGWFLIDWPAGSRLFPAAADSLHAAASPCLVRPV